MPRDVVGAPQRTLEPLVDIGIPTFRRPGFLREAVDSIVSQTFDRWRLLVSEDGPSTREAGDAIKPYLSDPRIRFRAHEKSVGVVENKNGLLRAASAPYVAILDDDDRWGPEFLARRVAFLEQHPDCAFVFSGYVEIGETGRHVARPEYFAGTGVLQSSHFVPRLLEANPVRTPTVLVRRTAYEAVGMSLDERFPGIYDWEMWLRLGMRFPVGYLAIRDVGYRVHEVQETFRARNADQVLHLLEHAQGLAGHRSFEIRLSERAWRRLRSHWTVSSALDDLEEGKRRAALSALLQATRLAPRSLLDRRAIAVVAGSVLGQRVGRIMAGPVREFVRRRRWTRRS